MNQLEFSTWVGAHWANQTGRPSKEQLAIMALGLGGEAGEVMEAELAEDEAELKLELGDVLHYATAIACRFDLTLSGSRSHEWSGINGFMPFSVSKVLELIKKNIRDDRDPVAKGLSDRLNEVYYDISETCATYSLTMDEVRQANYDKLIERLGSGRFANGRAVAREPVALAA